MKTYGAVDGGEWSASRPGRFTPGELSPPPVWTLWRREKYLAPAGNQTPAVQPVARRYTDWTLTAKFLMYDSVIADVQCGSLCLLGININ
jgi:hypothetical protein